MYAEENKELAHGIDDIDTLFPDYKDVYPGAPEVLLRDQGWVDVVMSKAHKSPISRIRTRQTDARDVTVRGSGYQKTKKKAVAPNVKLLKRTTDPQTVYRKDALNRDDIVDITDFDVVEYQYGIMRSNLNEEIATAIMIGDGREDGVRPRSARSTSALSGMTTSSTPSTRMWTLPPPKASFRAATLAQASAPTTSMPRPLSPQLCIPVSSTRATALPTSTARRTC